MRKITEILRLKHEAKLSHEKIALALGVSKGVVSKYVSLAQAKNLSWPLPESMDEAALERFLFPAPPAPTRFVEPDLPRIHHELKRKGVTLQLLWAEYAATHGEAGYRYSQFCHRYRLWVGQQRRSMRQVHRAGEKMFLDYCGPTVPVVDPTTGELRNAQVFVAVLGASSYTYAEATWTQGLPDWIASHQRALRFFGGATELWVPDNLRSAVSRPCRYTPEPNATYADLARHYGCAILPARPYKPKDKAKVEVAVQGVERWILARLRHHIFHSLAALNQAIAELLESLNSRPFQRQSYSRRDLFESIDRPALKPLPLDAYEYAEWKQVKPGIDYHVEFDGRLYSVPHALVGHVLELRCTATTIEVLHRGQRVAVHPRAGAGRFSTLPDHMPKSHRAHQQWSPGRFMNWAKEIGVATLHVVEHQLTNRPHPEHGYRACLGLLSLAKRYSRERLEAACLRALAIQSPTYRSVSSILEKGLDRQPNDAQSESNNTLPSHGNVRGPGYYN